MGDAMRRAGTAFVIATGLLTAACDEEAAPPQPQPTPTATQALTITDKGQPRLDLDLPPDRLTLEGTVISTTPTRLLLDYGTSEVTVDLGAWRVFREQALISPGDRVIVSGPINEEFIAKRVLKARSVFIAPIHSLFFVEGAEDEDFGLGRLGTEAAGGATDAAADARNDNADPGVRIAGFVTEVDANTFSLGGEDARISVNIAQLADNPLDDEGFQRLVPGMRVLVWGTMKAGDGGAPRIEARRVVSLIPGTGPSPASSPSPTPSSERSDDLTLTDRSPPRSSRDSATRN